MRIVACRYVVQVDVLHSTMLREAVKPMDHFMEELVTSDPVLCQNSILLERGAIICSNLYSVIAM